MSTFCQTYPQIWQSLPTELRFLLLNSRLAIPTQTWESVTPELGVDGKTLLTKLSFTHLAELIPFNDPSTMSCDHSHSVRQAHRDTAQLQRRTEEEKAHGSCQHVSYFPPHDRRGLHISMYFVHPLAVRGGMFSLGPKDGRAKARRAIQS